MRKLILVLLVLIIFGLGSMYFVAGKSEQAYRNSVALVNDTPGIQAKVVSYTPGYFKSQAQTEIKIGKEIYTTHDTIYHGPIVVDVQHAPFVYFALGKVNSTITPSPFNVPISAEFTFPYFGGMRLYSKSPAFEFQDGGTTINGTSSIARGNIDRQFKTYDFENTIDSMTIRHQDMPQSAGTDIKGAKIQLHYEKSSAVEDLKIQYSLDQISTSDKKADVSDLSVQAEIKLKPDIFEVIFKSNIDKLHFQNKKLGPIVFHLRLEDLDRKALDWALQRHQTLTQEDFNTIVKMFLKHSLILSIPEAKALLPEGQFDLKTKLKIGGPDIQEPLNADNILLTLDGNVDFSLPKSSFKMLMDNYIASKLVKDANFQALPDRDKRIKMNEEYNRIVEILKQSGVLTETPPNFIIKFTYNKGQWLVEGKPILKPEI